MTAIDPFVTYSVQALFHFTDTRNIHSIRKLGGLYSLRELLRRGAAIAAPGGNQWSHDADKRLKLDRYVHLCFQDEHPMAHVAMKDGRIKQPIFLQIDSNVRRFPGVLFAGDVSNKSGVKTCPLRDGLSGIDFEVLYRWTNWGDPKIQERLKAARKCEILVPDHIPLKFIRNLPNG